MSASALHAVTTNSSNTGIGYQALQKATGTRNVALGKAAGSSLVGGSDNIAIGNAGVSTDSGVIRIGTSGLQTAAYLAGVSGKAITGPTKTVVINSQGRLGTSTAPSAAQLMTIIDHQQKEIDALRREVRR